MINNRKNKKGFTLVELLTVISIIALLSSVVYSSLQSAKAKARDAVVKVSVRELSKLMALEYQDNGSYSNLQPCSWVPQSKTCDEMFSGTYASQARAICNSIVKNAPAIWGTPGYSFLLCNSLDYNQKYSIMATLSSVPHFFCAGSSGVSDNVYYWISVSVGDDIRSNPARWKESPVGCYFNP
jgi:prepilin-type N-terminal cleavage/methylation domain-containing protein